jgi:uncharacterized protein (TIGR04255 family)
MPHKQLKNKPLVEVIFEIRWELVQTSPGYEHDPHYKLLLGRFYDRVSRDYPEHEQLPVAGVPDEIVAHIVQHRFRVGKGSWPLFQIGPGVVTANSTADYTWEDFSRRAVCAVKTLFDAHPKPSELKVIQLILRYVDAVEFDYSSDNVYSFLQDKLKIGLSLPQNLFNGTGVEQRPKVFSWHSAFSCNKPTGVVNIKFATGQKKENTPAIVWETTLQSSASDVPILPDGIEEWLDAAHEVTSDWFFKLIQGELERRFDNG